jgi:hypothetical protein
MHTRRLPPLHRASGTVYPRSGPVLWFARRVGGMPRRCLRSDHGTQAKRDRRDALPRSPARPAADVAHQN